MHKLPPWAKELAQQCTDQEYQRLLQALEQPENDHAKHKKSIPENTMIEVTTQTTGHSVVITGVIRNSNGQVARCVTRTTNPSRFGALREAVRYFSSTRPDIQNWIWAEVQDHISIEEKEVNGMTVI